MDHYPRLVRSHPGFCDVGPASNQMRDGDGDTTGRLIAAAAYDVSALTAATAVGVFKPGKSFRQSCRDRRVRV
jgi:hypothetical protein